MHSLGLGQPAGVSHDRADRPHLGGGAAARGRAHDRGAPARRRRGRAGAGAAAAWGLGVEPTTVSRRLGALEKELGVPLFYRTTTGYLPTAHAKNMMAN